MKRAPRKAPPNGPRPREQESDFSSEYDVGYGRPPKHAQFKPGQSGNPRGRPKRRKTLQEMLREVLLEKVAVREGERVYKTEALIALARTTLRYGLRGDVKFVSAAIALMRLFGLSEAEAEEVLDAPISDADNALIADFLRRARGRAPSGGSPLKRTRSTQRASRTRRARR